MTTSNDPDEIRADIERTRAALSNDVDELAESVKPQERRTASGRQGQGGCRQRQGSRDGLRR